MLVSLIGCFSIYNRWLVSTQLDPRNESTHFSRVYSVVHDLNPAFEGGYLKQTQVRFPDVIEIHPGILPCIILRFTSVVIGNDFVAEGGFISVHALIQSKQFSRDGLVKICIHTLKYFPANNCTPMIANINQNIRHTSNTLKMDGIACTNAFTTTLIPCILDNARKGLNALNVLMVLNAWIPPAPHKDATKLIKDTSTMMKSNQHQAFVKYRWKPSANHLINISKKNITVNIRSM